VNKQEQINKIVARIPLLTNGQIYWLQRVLKVFEAPHDFKLLKPDLLDAMTLENFGDALRIHHSFSAEPFSKDKFEYVLEKVVNMSGHSAKLAKKGNPGHDITINSVRISLKTQADKGIKEDKIWISKFMELGKGKWGDDPADLKPLLEKFFDHLKNYDRILTLRALRKAPEWFYELVEIPKSVMEAARNGELKMMEKTKQFPRPGYCYVKLPKSKDTYQLYFDAGSERKLQVKNMPKSICTLHATWSFSIPPE
jgi:hypothetical protein